MAHALHHAESSARKFGGLAEDYLEIHTWLDASKSAFAAPAHRALRHHATGVFEAEERFGVAIVNSASRRVPVRFIAERHVREDLGRIPSLQDWLGDLPLKPWMLGGRIEQGEDPEDGDLSVERWRAEVEAGGTILGWIDWVRARGGGESVSLPETGSGVRLFLDVSTGHLHPETRDWLDDLDAEDAPSTFLRGSCGWLIHVSDEPWSAWPDDLRAVLEEARRRACDYVLLDADGPVHDDLPWHGDDDARPS